MTVSKLTQTFWLYEESDIAFLIKTSIEPKGYVIVRQSFPETMKKSIFELLAFLTDLSDIKTLFFSEIAPKTAANFALKGDLNCTLLQFLLCWRSSATTRATSDN